MNENEEIKVVRLGDKAGCIFDDLVQIQLSPDWLEDITNVFKENAINDKDYVSQGFNREKADFFSLAFETWRKERNEVDNKEKTEI